MYYEDKTFLLYSPDDERLTTPTIPGGENALCIRGVFLEDRSAVANLRRRSIYLGWSLDIRSSILLDTERLENLRFGSQEAKRQEN